MDLIWCRGMTDTADFYRWLLYLYNKVQIFNNKLMLLAYKAPNTSATLILESYSLSHEICTRQATLLLLYYDYINSS